MNTKQSEFNLVMSANEKLIDMSNQLKKIDSVSINFQMYVQQLNLLCDRYDPNNHILAINTAQTILFSLLIKLKTIKHIEQVDINRFKEEFYYIREQILKSLEKYL